MFETTPAIMLIKIKSIKDIDSKLKTMQKIFAIIAKNNDKTRVNTKEEIILLFNLYGSDIVTFEVFWYFL